MSDCISLPKDWRICRLEEVGEVIGGGTPDSGDPAYWGGGIAWATPTEITNLRSMFISRTRQTVSEEGLRRSSAKIHPAGTVLITSRASIGFVAVNTIPMATNQGFQSVRCSTALHNFYLYYLISHCQTELAKLASGSTFLEVSSSNMRRLRIAVPPLLEQRKIAEILRSVDDNIEKTQALIAKLQDLKKATMQEVLTKGIGHTKFKDSLVGRIPVEWEVRTVADVIESAIDGPFGSNLKTEHYVRVPGVRVVRLQNIGIGYLDGSDRAYVSEQHARSLARHQVCAGDRVEFLRVGNSAVKPLVPAGGCGPSGR